MADYREIARRAALAAGIDPGVFLRQIAAESSFNPGAVSPKGAIGIAQIIPSTARAWGVNPRDPVASLRAAAQHMAAYARQFGSTRNALIAYNAGPGAVGRPLPAETRSYIARILGGGGGGGGVPRAAAPAAPSGASALLTGGGTAGASVPEGSQGALPLLQALMARQQAPPPSAPLPTPAFLAGPSLPQGAQVPMSSAPPAPKPDIAALLAAIQTPGGSFSTPAADPVSVTVGGAQTAGNAPRGASGRLGRVIVARGADRPGVSTRPEIVNFVRRVAGLYGQPLTIGTGTNHSRLTVNGTVSDHWRGEAADVPLTGAALVRAGQDALIAAGMAPARARRINGGGFNVGGYQIIFNTNAPGWGNHTTHLHIGRRA